jgi:hypothetical protein
MSVWTALVIVQTMFSPNSPVVNATSAGPADIKVGMEAPTDPTISVQVKSPPPTTKVERMTGVEADTYVNVPAVTTLSFPSSEMCEAAAVVLRKQNGAYSVSCVQTQ